MMNKKLLYIFIAIFLVLGYTSVKSAALRIFTVPQGGTGQGTTTLGDIFYADGTNSVGKLGIGATGKVLKVAGGVPTWGTDSTGGGGGAGSDFDYFVGVEGDFISPTTSIVGFIIPSSASSTFIKLTSLFSSSTQATTTNLFVSNRAVISSSTIGNIVTGTLTATSTTASSSLKNILFSAGQGTSLSLSGAASIVCTSCITDANVIDALTISGGTIDNSAIGVSTRAAGNFTSLGVGIGTTTAGVIETTGVINIQGAGTSTFTNGIVLTGGCILTPAGTCAGTGGSATPTLTTEKPFDTCSPQVSNTTFAPGGAFFDYAGDFPAIQTLNATSSRIICIVHIPKDIAAVPAASVFTTLSATTSGNAIWDIYATTTTPSYDGGTGGSAYGALTNGLTVILNASSTAASRMAIHGTANYNADATTTSLSLTLTGGNDLIIIYERAASNANDTVENGVFFLDKASGIRWDIKVN